MRLTQAIELFCLEATSRRLTPSTLRFYKQRLAFISKVLGDKELHEVSIHDCRACIAQATERSAVHTYVTLKRFFKFALDEDLLDKDPTLKLVRPKSPKIVVEPFSPAEMQALMKAARGQQGWTAIRDVAILAMLLGTGIRRSELCGLQESDVRLDEGTIKVYGKGRKERIIPLPLKLRKLLLRYTFERERTRVYGNLACPYFFRDRKGQQLQPDALSQLIRRLGRSIGIKAWTHRTRHSFCTFFMDHDGADVLVLKELAGWSTLAMAQRYVKPSLRKMAASQESFSPVNQL